MRILVATDAWHPQVNGVVRTYERLADEARSQGAEITFFTPAGFRTIPCPAYPGIRLAIPNRKRAFETMEAAAPDLIHVATEGPVGLMARSFCKKQGRPFTTSYHTKFPEYASALLSVPPSWGFALMRQFHNSGAGTMVATPSLQAELRQRGFARLMPWTRGVDTDLYRPRSARVFGADRPVFLYVGRVSKEKNLEAFLSADLQGLKVVVGTGPHLETLRQRFPDAVFTGAKSGEELAEHYASANVFVFPSRTDTFGLVMLEAMAAGVPVAAYPVTGPLDVVTQGVSGILDEDIAKAATQALKLDRAAVCEDAFRFSWAKTAELFLNNITSACGYAAVARTSRKTTRAAAAPAMSLAQKTG
jgi:1,2-diacylglycerol 3-alpha-glucosyltransferase/glucuronosyltransferase